MAIDLLELKQGGLQNIIIFPHAGGLARSYTNLVSLVPNGYGLFATEYPNFEESKLINFTDLAKKYASLLAPRGISNDIFIGISFGGYLAYQIVLIIYTLTKVLPKGINLISVMDIPSLKAKITDPNFNVLSNMHINETINNITTHTLQELSQFVAKDIEILKSIQLRENAPLPADLTIINGLEDKVCNNAQTYEYWAKFTNQRLHVKGYSGGHLPKDLIKIIEECIR